MSIIETLDRLAFPYISAGTRQATERGVSINLASKEIEALIQRHSQTTVSQKLERVLSYITERARVPGGFCDLVTSADWPLFDCNGEEELDSYLKHLLERGFIVIYHAPQLTTRSSPTIPGFQEVEPKLRPGGDPTRCFVAMSFDDELYPAYSQGIEAALKDCGVTAVRMKELHHNQDITDRLLAEIRRSGFVVADFTGHKDGVYYEAGFARGLGREVINACRDTDFHKLHFDTNHLNHIKWSTPEDLREKLRARIQATILPKA